MPEGASPTESGESQPDGIRRDGITLAESGEIGLHLWNLCRKDFMSWACGLHHNIKTSITTSLQGHLRQAAMECVREAEHNPLSKKTALTRLQANISLSHQKQVCKQTP